MDFTKAAIAAGSATVALAATLGTAAFAQSSASAETATLDPVQCAAAMDTFEAAMWPAKDKLYAAEKAASKTRTAAMKASLTLDEEARKEAMKDAMETFHATMETAHEEFRTETLEAHEALKDACPGAGRMLMHGGKKGFGHKGMGPMGKMRGMMERGEKPQMQQ